MRRVAFATLGCKVNQSETDMLAGLFQQQGYTTVEFSTAADIYVVNTCSVTHLGERKSRQLIRRAVRNHPGAVVVVTGCYAQVSPQEVAAVVGVDVIIGTQDRGQIVTLAEEALRSRRKLNVVTDITNADHFEDIPLLATPGRTRAFLKIQEGCENFCSYCIIPYARGRLRSRILDSISREAQKLAEGGFKEIVLTGIHLGAYGRDLPGEVALTDAVKTVLSAPGFLRLRLGSLETTEVSDELLHLLQTDPRLCPHLHLPLQAGDDRVLAAMNRHYTTAQYRELLSNITAKIPGIAISTDIIVGFPGETEEMHENALQFVDNMNFSRMHIFPYSRRQGTPAATFPDQVAEPLKKQRMLAMGQLAERKAGAFAAQFIGRQVTVLSEAIDGDYADGLTGHYVRVYIPANQATLGTIQTVTAQGLLQGGLRGSIAD